VAAIAATLTLARAPAARAESPAPAAVREVGIEADALSVIVTYAGRVAPRVLVGVGAGGGFSPILGTTYATGTHFDSQPGVVLLDVAALQGFARFELARWLQLDAGLRAGLFIHGQEDFTGGRFVAAYASPTVGWRWFWIGPRISAAVLSEDQNTASALAIDFVTVRLAFRF